MSIADDEDSIELTDANATGIMQGILGIDVLANAFVGPSPPDGEDGDYGSAYGWIELVLRNGRHVRVWGGMMLIDETVESLN